MLVGRRTAAQLAKIQSSCVHLSVCFTVGKGKGKGTHPLAQGTGNLFFCCTGLLTAMRNNRPLVPQPFLVGKSCATTTLWFRGKILLFLGRGGGGGCWHEATGGG